MLGALLLLISQLSAAAIAVTEPAPRPESTQPSAVPLTMAAAVTQATTASPRRRAAAIGVESARESARFAVRPPNPFIDLRTENWSPSARTPSPNLDVFAVITQPFELGAKRTLRRQLATSETEVAATTLRLVERELALDTVRVYIRALRARALVETLTGNRDGLAMLVDSVGRRVDEGYSAEADLLKFRTEAARINGDVARAQLELDRSLTALGTVIGSASPIEASQLVEPARLPVPSASTDTVIASVGRHPSVVAAGAAVDRARQLTAIERARHLPDPAVTGGYKRTAGFDTAVVGLSFSLPFFDRNHAAIARSLGLERGAAADRDALVAQVAADTASLLRAAETIAEQADRAPQELLEPAEGVRRATLAAFREGTADVLKLIDAERVYADVHRAAIDLRLDALQTVIEARFALGQETIP
jgi:cobalt-zinc-cadmium efflux system outer membrane protein